MNVNSKDSPLTVLNWISDNNSNKTSKKYKAQGITARTPTPNYDSVQDVPHAKGYTYKPKHKRRPNSRKKTQVIPLSSSWPSFWSGGNQKRKTKKLKNKKNKSRRK